MIASRRVRTAALFTGLLILMAGLSACDETAITPPLPTPGGTAEATVTAPVTPSPSVTASPTHTPTATADATTPPPSTPADITDSPPTDIPPSATSTVQEPAASASPTFEPTATPRPDTVQVDAFTASPATADPGSTITLSWQTTGAHSVDLRKTSANGASALVASRLDPTGALDVTVAEHERNHVRYVLIVNYGGDPLTRETVVELTCPLAWFFDAPPPPDLCPLFAAEAGPGIAQPFEHGLMILNTATGFIHVLYDTSGEYRRTSNTWSAGMPEVSPEHTPPDGLYPPERGFGILWEETRRARAARSGSSLAGPPPPPPGSRPRSSARRSTNRKRRTRASCRGRRAPSTSSIMASGAPGMGSSTRTTGKPIRRRNA